MIRERFEYYTLDDSSGWTEEGLSYYITFNSYNSDLDGYGLKISDDAAVYRTISTSGYQDITIVIGIFIHLYC